MDNPLARARWLVLLVPAALLGGAYVAQYAFGLPPCEMCWWQRYPLFAALALAVLAWLRPPGRMLIGLAALAILVSGLIGGFHAGVEYRWWQGLTACSIPLREQGGDPLAAILATPLVRCDTAPWTLFGISLAGFNFLISTTAALAIMQQLRRSKGER